MALVHDVSNKVLACLEAVLEAAFEIHERGVFIVEYSAYQLHYILLAVDIFYVHRFANRFDLKAVSLASGFVAAVQAIAYGEDATQQLLEVFI